MEKIIRKSDNSLSILKIGKVYDENDEKIYDLRNIFIQLNIYSNINDIITTGDVTVSEQGNLIADMPIDGTEYIEIEFCPVENEYEKYHRIFFIYAIDTVIESKDFKTYTLRFTDSIGMINNDTRFAIKYEDKIENIIDSIQTSINENQNNLIYKKILEKYSILENPFVFKIDDDISITSMYDMKFVSPYWKPLQLLSYLTSRAVSEYSSQNVDKAFCDCMFFQNRKGEFILTNYYNMFKFQLKNFKNDDIILEKEIGNSSSEKYGLKEARYGIVNYSMPKIFNTQLQKMRGILGFTDNVTDFLRVKCEPQYIKKEDIEDIFDTYKLELDYEYIPYNAINFTENSIFLYNECDINYSLDEEHYKRFVLPYEKSISLRQLIEYCKITIELNGCSDLDIGRFVKINLGNSEKSMVQYINDAKWVISSITHNFSNDGSYKTYVECFTPYLHRIDKEGNIKNG